MDKHIVEIDCPQSLARLQASLLLSNKDYDISEAAARLLSGCLGPQAKACADDLYINVPASLAYEGLKNFADGVSADGVSADDGNVNYNKKLIFCQAAHSDGVFDIQSSQDLLKVSVCVLSI